MAPLAEWDELWLSFTPSRPKRPHYPHTPLPRGWGERREEVPGWPGLRSFFSKLMATCCAQADSWGGGDLPHHSLPLACGIPWSPGSAQVMP